MTYRNQDFFKRGERAYIALVTGKGQQKTGHGVYLGHGKSTDCGSSQRVNLDTCLSLFQLDTYSSYSRPKTFCPTPENPSRVVTMGIKLSHAVSIYQPPYLAALGQPCAPRKAS
nr:hypothetical protein L203_02637 [Cryptococcus depauperatus CBS 7841]